MLYIRIDSTTVAIYPEVTEVTAAQQKVSEDNFTVGNCHGSSYKLSETPQKRGRLRLQWDLAYKKAAFKN